MTSMVHFPMPNSIPMSWLYILTACMRVFSSFSFFANNLMSSMYIRWLIFSCYLLSLYPAAHFLSMWFSGIMAIMNSKGDSASPWKIPLWIFVLAMLLPPVVSSCCHYSFRVFRISVSWWFFTGVWVTPSLLNSPGLFSVFCPSLIMLSFGWSPIVRQLPNPSGPLIIL